MLISLLCPLCHSVSYVRKNAVLTVFTVYSAHPDLIPDAPELIEQFLYAETNPSAKRNAFLMLYHCNEDKAVTYLDTCINTINGTGEAFQLIALELIRKVCRTNPTLKAAYIRAIFTLVNSPVHAVSFEGANTLVSLSSAPTAVRAAVSAYTNLLGSESENNVKLVILQRLSELRTKNERILQEMLMDILRTLSSPNMEIRKQTLTLALHLITQRNVEDVVQLLKKELIKADSPEYQQTVQQRGNDGYRKMLVDAMHECAVRFPHVVSTVVHLLMQYVGDEQPAAALDVVYFIREIVEEYSQLRDEILLKVLDNFDEIKSADVYRVCLWIIGEYATDSVVLQRALEAIKRAVGPLPLVRAVSASEGAVVNVEEKRKEEEDVKGGGAGLKPVSAGIKRGPTVLADGTYASQSAASSAPAAVAVTAAASTSNTDPALRTLLIHGEYFLAGCLAVTFTKLVLRFTALAGQGSDESNREIATALLLLTSLLRAGSLSTAIKPIDPDSQQRIALCIRVLLDNNEGGGGKVVEVFAAHSRQVFADMLKDQRKKSDIAAGKNKEKVAVKTQADDLISIRQLKNKLNPSAADEDDGVSTLDNEDADVLQATGAVLSPSQLHKVNDISSTLYRVHQLTGFSDPVYAEAHLMVQSYDIVLNFYIYNQTPQILQNVAVELNTSGDLKVVERPAIHTLAPHGHVRVQSVIKLSSTESGVIFGNITYDNSSGTLKQVVVLANIHMDIEDYIGPSYVTDSAFRAMWAEFEWYALRIEPESMTAAHSRLVTDVRSVCTVCCAGRTRWLCPLRSPTSTTTSPTSSTSPTCSASPLSRRCRETPTSSQPISMPSRCSERTHC